MQRNTGVGSSPGGPIAGVVERQNTGSISRLAGPALVACFCGFLLAACGAGGAGGGGGDLGEDGGGGDIGFDDYAFQYGMNSAVHNWSSRAIIFADGMMRGCEFGIVRGGAILWDVAPLIPLGQEPPLLGEGWPDFGALAPDERAGSRFLNGMAGTMPDGRVEPYVVTWEGTGSCSLNGLPVVHAQNRTSNRVEYFIDPTAGGGNAQLVMFIDESSIVDPVRAVHVWLPGMEEEKPLFWPPFLEKVEQMNHGNGPYSWRVSEWSRVNMYGRGSGNLLFDFDLAGMIYPDSPSQGTRRGMCPEFMVAFCNATKTNLHMQVPHRTDELSEEDYVTFLTETLTRIRDGAPAVPGINGGEPFAGLDPDLTMTLELSNEIWNSGYPQHWFMQREATRKGITFHAQVASQIELVFGVADQVYSGAYASRLNKYVAAVTADPPYIGGVLSNLPPDFEVNSIGPAAYFGPSNSIVSGWMQGADPQTGACPNCPTVEEVIAASRERIADVGVLLEIHRNVAENYTNPDGSHPSLVIYEGGQHIVAGFQPWWPEANAAQVHPLMYDAYVSDLVPMLNDVGVELMLWYSFMTDQNPMGGNGIGPFGIWNDMEQTITLPVGDPYVHEGAPKAAAIYRGPPLLE